MENKIVALKAEQELIRTGYAVEYDVFIKQLELIIKRYFIDPFDATCIRRWVREEAFPQRSICINFEMGFYNPVENRVDFGSDMFFTYNTSTQSLEVNYGTCGSYSRKHEYQVRRVRTLAYVWDHIHEIEAELNSYALEIAPVVFKYHDKLENVEHMISSIENEIKTQQKNNIAETLQVGKALFYNETCDLRGSSRLFSGKCEITKITPKFVVIKGAFDEKLRIKKADILDHALRNYITIAETF